MEKKIKSVLIKKEFDERADVLEDLGTYSDDTNNEWSICRHCGQYLHHAELWNRV